MLTTPYWIYGVLAWLLRPVLVLKLRRRGRKEPLYLERIVERFGCYAQQAPAAGHYLWVHAVSLGETRAAIGLIQALRERWPHNHLLLTHGTATGLAEGKKLLREGDLQVWQPWDDPISVNRFLVHFRPAMALMLETEVWPTLLRRCKQYGVPTFLVNARMSEKSLNQYQRWKSLFIPTFKALSGVLAQTPADADRLKQLGAPVIGMTGNIKFDAPINPAQLALGRQLRQELGRPVVMLASSREGEELIWQQAFRSWTARQSNPTRQAMFNRVLWLLVPRHPQRFDEVALLLTTAGYVIKRKSQWANALETPPTHTQVLLGDTLGEMAFYFGMSDVALLGGSFQPLGGQNLIESAACGCPILMGPSTFNFHEAASQAEQHGAAMRVSDMNHALDQVMNWLLHPEGLQHARSQATRFALEYQGAVERTMNILNCSVQLPEQKDQK